VFDVRGYTGPRGESTADRGRFVGLDGRDVTSRKRDARNLRAGVTLASETMRFASPPTFSCRLVPDRDRVILHVVAELDLEAAPHLVAAVDELLEVGFTRIVIDLRRVGFVASAGIHALLTAHRSAEESGCALELVRAAPAVHRVFELTRTESVLRFCDDVDGVERAVDTGPP
jgi:anti-anti-sigma factor